MRFCLQIIRGWIELTPKSVRRAIQIVHSIFEIVFCFLRLVPPRLRVTPAFKFTARAETAHGQAPDLFIKADLGTARGVQNVVDRILQEWGGLDVLVDNVGGTETKPGGFEVLSDEDWQSILEVNLLAAVRFDRAFLPGMIERKSGVVIHISSVAHRLPFPNSTLAYAAAKAALTTYSKGLAKAVAPKGVRVTTISPGFIETSGAKGMIADISRASGISEDAARQRIMDMLGGIPMGHRIPFRLARFRELLRRSRKRAS